MNPRALVRVLTLGAAILPAGCTVYGPPPRPWHPVAVGPRLIIIAGSDIRYCDECDEDVFFYLDWWYVYRPGGWYRCDQWGGTWVVVEPGRLPAAFIRVPPDRFRHRWGRYHPAHDHHPDLDSWKPDVGPVDSKPADEKVGDRKPDKKPDKKAEPGKVGDKDKDKDEPPTKEGRGRRGRGRGPR